MTYCLKKGAKLRLRAATRDKPRAFELTSYNDIDVFAFYDDTNNTISFFHDVPPRTISGSFLEENGGNALFNQLTFLFLNSEVNLQKQDPS